MFDPSRRSNDLRARLTTTGELLVGYVGRLAAEKELELLTHLDEIPGIRVVMVGGGPEEDKLKKLLPKAEFRGVLHGDELGAAYASLDIFVHTGRHETYCQAAQEALAAGVPVVAPKSGGPIDVVDEGTAGFLYAPGSGQELTAYVRKLVEDPMLRKRMSLAARRSVEGRSWKSVNDLLVSHYRAAIAEKSGADRLVRTA
jgi:phosphatidylinositol alpha 1,6-mannosyltransferase